MHVTVDFESYSEADLKKVGAWKYWEHRSTEPIVCVFDIDGAEVTWLFGQPLPEPVAAATGLLVFRKVGPTPPGFPRRPGIARKRPLA